MADKKKSQMLPVPPADLGGLIREEGGNERKLIRTIVDLLKCKNDKVRLMSAEALLTYQGHVKPTQINVGGTGVPIKFIMELDPDDSE